MFVFVCFGFVVVGMGVGRGILFKNLCFGFFVVMLFDIKGVLVVVISCF